MLLSAAANQVASDWISLERELCRRSLADFVQRAWHVLEPSQPYVHGEHINSMCRHLEAVTAGDITRLLINIPPGTMKSMLVGVFWPAWQWGPQGLASNRIIGASHEMGLAVRDARRMRALVTSDWFQERWPMTMVSDQNQKTYFENDSTGWRQANAVASMTGRRGDCLVGDVMVSTDQGDVAIRDIVNCGMSCNVLSAETDTGRLVYRPIQAVARRRAETIYRVRTACGRVVECTGDHRFYTAGGYKPARLLSSGDVLLRSLREGGKAKHIQLKKSDETGQVRKGVLQSEMLDDGQQFSTGQGRQFLHGMRSQDSAWATAMLAEVSSGSQNKEDGGLQAQSAAIRMRALRDNVPAENPETGHAVLFSQMREQGACITYTGREKPNVEGRSECPQIRSAKFENVQEGALRDFGEGRACLRSVQQSKRIVRSPHGYGYGQQHLAKFGDALQIMSCDMAQYPKGESDETTVAVVEKISRSEMVYDIQVEGTQCFFANGILVHNCVIWDDPHSVEAALSPAHRETAVRVFQETLPTRLNNPDRSAIVIVMQRLHEGDVSGLILENDYGYEHLCLPMEFDPARRCQTSIGFTDWRETEGELLFPERFPAEVVERDRTIMGPYAFAGQMQQTPLPRGGGFFEWEKLEVRQAPNRIDRLIRYWDKAGTKGGGAYTAGVKMGVLPNGDFIVLDVVRGQWAAAERERVIRQTAEMDGIECRVAVEQEPGSGGKESAEGTIRNLAGYSVEADRATGAKELRAEPYAAQVAAGNVKLAKGDWNQMFIDEHKSFPVGKYKDQIDAASGAFARLAINRQPRVRVL